MIVQIEMRSGEVKEYKKLNYVPPYIILIDKKGKEIKVLADDVKSIKMNKDFEESENECNGICK